MRRAACWAARSSHLEDSATIDSVAEAKATKSSSSTTMSYVIFAASTGSTAAGHQGSCGREGQEALHSTRSNTRDRNATRSSSAPARAGAAGRSLIPWLMQQNRCEEIYLPSADYIWPHTMNKKVRQVVTANGASIVGEEYFPLDHADYSKMIEKDHLESVPRWCQYDRTAWCLAFLEQSLQLRLHEAGGKIVCTYFDENFLNMVPAEHVGVCTVASTTTRPSAIRSARN